MPRDHQSTHFATCGRPWSARCPLPSAHHSMTCGSAIGCRRSFQGSSFPSGWPCSRCCAFGPSSASCDSDSLENEPLTIDVIFMTPLPAIEPLDSRQRRVRRGRQPLRISTDSSRQTAYVSRSYPFFHCGASDRRRGNRTGDTASQHSTPFGIPHWLCDSRGGSDCALRIHGVLHGIPFADVTCQQKPPTTSNRVVAQFDL
jgi:hypothetical protein